MGRLWFAATLAATLAAGLAVAAGIASPTVAWASCAGPPEPSVHAFSGTVVRTSHEGRVAIVRRDGGDIVTVLGGPDANGTGLTSVDRRFAAGVRYEFHPFNAQSPFQDNICSATVQLSSPPPPSEVPTVNALPVDAAPGPVRWAVPVGLGLLIGAGIAGAATSRGQRTIARRRDTH